ncbi:M14 family metallopeptidase [Pseudoalteromonas denitrificans]|uniref:Murein tripeptide amidase MpaA n=1 Tax=Pseudoalteromonas denitrificans DSM 6059 TaxID=1123010 RepID=A0A1I1NV22_9GAMM|nr:M14-type cytosolic carboxypeptidase [Pseudoalteromonas denitrificans]SFD01246.1 Murein tripeptide amidase MpaA [Pseudoalteromonas denitrificans DSM 6059]
MKISSQFDSGNILVKSAENPLDIQLEINKDKSSDFFQWFHFRLETQQDQLHKINISNLENSAYPEGWDNYQAVASYDRQTWFRLPTSYENGTLTIECEPECSHLYIAYFAPYSYERHLDLVYWAQGHEICEIETLGHTLDKRDMTVLRIGEPASDKKNIWITARQHPGETMAQWFVEGLLHKLLDDEDAHAAALLSQAVFYIVPNMNPDGSVRGHLRTNAKGVNLNREWQSPSMESSPEVFLVRDKMLNLGVDMFLDIHGDEALPYNFVAGSEGIPSYDDKMKSLEESFKSALLTITPEFQDEFGYPKDEPGQANLTVGSCWVAEQFKCLSYTIEMPFKDNINLPDADYGWSDRRSYSFGQDTLAAIVNVVATLR